MPFGLVFARTRVVAPTEEAPGVDALNLLFLRRYLGATTFSITTFSITTLRITDI
jgi:hypothetical protein